MLHLVEDVNDIESGRTNAGRDGVAHCSDDRHLVGNIIYSFHRSQISTSCGLSWWTEVAGGAELLVSQGKATGDGWWLNLASSLLLLSSPNHCSWKVLPAGVHMKEAAQASRAGKVQVSIRSKADDHICATFTSITIHCTWNKFRKACNKECSWWWN